MDRPDNDCLQANALSSDEYTRILLVVRAMSRLHATHVLDAMAVIVIRSSGYLPKVSLFNNTHHDLESISEAIQSRAYRRKVEPGRASRLTLRDGSLCSERKLFFNKQTLDVLE